MNEKENKLNLKNFFIKLLGITVSIIIIINITYNILFRENVETINKFLQIMDRDGIEMLKNKARSEIKKGLAKDKLFNEEDKMLLNNFYQKISTELSNNKKD